MGVAKGGDIGSVGDSVRRINYVVKDEAGNEVGKGVLVTNPLAALTAVSSCPPTMNLGDATVELEANSVAKSSKTPPIHIDFRFRNFGGPSLKFLRRTKPKDRCSWAIIQT